MMRNPFRFAIAFLVLLVGLLWIGQGTGVIGGSFMSDQPVWAVIGAVLVVVAAGLAWTARGTAAR